MSLALLGGVFAASLLGSLHCAGMCGGIACFVAGTAARGPALALYHGGRLVSYAAAGALAGAAGRALDLGGEAAGLGRAGTVLAGALMLATGGLMLARGLGLRIGAPESANTLLGRAWRRATRFLAGADPGQRALAFGLLTVLLPCGWLYLFLATAAASGGPLAGAAVMAAFWAGSVPALLSVGLLARRLAPALRARLPVLAAGLLIAIAITALLPRLAPPAFASAPAGEEPACCRE